VPVDQADLARTLCKNSGQSHLFPAAHWPSPADPSLATAQCRMLSQLAAVHKETPGDDGLVGYIGRAVALLEASKAGTSPLSGFVPKVPRGRTLDPINRQKEYANMEARGMAELGKCGFVLVAGGLGERLGYGGIKIGLPTEMTTETSYMQLYAETILAYQAKHALPNQKLPLCIMTSGDTNARTLELLQSNSYFGLDISQVTIVQQSEGVAALTDNNARIAADPEDPYVLLRKPHGHGDVHALMYSEGVAKKWRAAGVEWAVFFQDTNGLAFHTLPAALGVSLEGGFIMNSIAVPRQAKQAIGGIALLENATTGESKTINIEYNQLDPLLRANGEEDVKDPKTGFSPFPGNINQLLFKLGPYADVLDRTRGEMPEFVNPKYADAAKTIFKKPTRLECMMQDFPTVLTASECNKVGFTSLPSKVCFSPVKNATADGIKMQTQGIHPGVASSGEADQHNSHVALMRSIGCAVEAGAQSIYSGVTITEDARIVLKPAFASSVADLKKNFPSPKDIKISQRSTLVVEGSGVVFESLTLDGALVVECEEGASGGIIRDLRVKNIGWVKVAVKDSEDEIVRMRGYIVRKNETKRLLVKKDGSVVDMDADADKKEPLTRNGVTANDDVFSTPKDMDTVVDKKAILTRNIVTADEDVFATPKAEKPCSCSIM